MSRHLKLGSLNAINAYDYAVMGANLAKKKHKRLMRRRLRVMANREYKQEHERE